MLWTQIHGDIVTNCNRLLGFHYGSPIKFWMLLRTTVLWHYIFKPLQLSSDL